MPANILNLPQYRVLRVEETDHDYHVAAEPVDVSSSCLHCQSDRLASSHRVNPRSSARSRIDAPGGSIQSGIKIISPLKTASNHDEQNCTHHQ